MYNFLSLSKPISNVHWYTLPHQAVDLREMWWNTQPRDLGCPIGVKPIHGSTASWTTWHWWHGGWVLGGKVEGNDIFKMNNWSVTGNWWELSTEVEGWPALVFGDGWMNRRWLVLRKVCSGLLLGHVWNNNCNCSLVIDPTSTCREHSWTICGSKWTCIWETNHQILSIWQLLHFHFFGIP